MVFTHAHYRAPHKACVNIMSHLSLPGTSLKMEAFMRMKM